MPETPYFKRILEHSSNYADINKKRSEWDLNPRARKRTTAFRVRLVTTTSIRFQTKCCGLKAAFIIIAVFASEIKGFLWVALVNIQILTSAGLAGHSHDPALPTFLQSATPIEQADGGFKPAQPQDTRWNRFAGPGNHNTEEAGEASLSPASKRPLTKTCIEQKPPMP